MAKGIIVMDIPEKCEYCELAKYVTCNDRFCMPMQKYVYIEQMYRKPDWCPIKKIPEKIEVLKYPHSMKFSRGWNACLNEIEGKM